MPAPAAIGPLPPDLSPLALFLAADPVVKTVMVLLALASVACWAILLDKLVRIGGLRRQAGRLERHLADGGTLGAAAGLGPLGTGLLQAGLAEWHDRDLGESRAERRARIERAMREAAAQHLRRAEPGLPFLATIGSAAPFVGLLGTVWGIMRSFTGIAATNDTSLAVVAPGIAEALFATAIGLVAAIPAVMAYNKLVTDLGRLGQRLDSAIDRIGARLAREPRATALHAAE
jgi:biopolymer transport protein ExbB/TolQ